MKLFNKSNTKKANRLPMKSKVKTGFRIYCSIVLVVVLATGIVEKVENGRVYTIEGNSNDSCKENSYPIGHYEILGYGCPAY